MIHLTIYRSRAVQFQLTFDIARSNIKPYYTQRDLTMTKVKHNSYTDLTKDTTLARPQGRAMWCLLWVQWRNMSVLYRKSLYVAVCHSYCLYLSHLKPHAVAYVIQSLIRRQAYHTLRIRHRVYSVHYIDVIMTTLASQITSLAVVYSIVYSEADERKHQSSASLAFVRGIHGDRWIPRTKGK